MGANRGPNATCTPQTVVQRIRGMWAEHALQIPEDFLQKTFWKPAAMHAVHVFTKPFQGIRGGMA
jgi:hypothetical protein